MLIYLQKHKNYCNKIKEDHVKSISINKKVNTLSLDFSHFVLYVRTDYKFGTMSPIYLREAIEREIVQIFDVLSLLFVLLS